MHGHRQVDVPPFWRRTAVSAARDSLLQGAGNRFSRRRCAAVATVILAGPNHWEADVFGAGEVRVIWRPASALLSPRCARHAHCATCRRTRVVSPLPLPRGVACAAPASAAVPTWRRHQRLSNVSNIQRSRSPACSLKEEASSGSADETLNPRRPRRQLLRRQPAARWAWRGGLGIVAHLAVRAGTARVSTIGRLARQFGSH